MMVGDADYFQCPVFSCLALRVVRSPRPPQTTDGANESPISEATESIIVVLVLVLVGVVLIVVIVVLVPSSVASSPVVPILAVITSVSVVGRVVSVVGVVRLVAGSRSRRRSGIRGNRRGHDGTRRRCSVIGRRRRVCIVAPAGLLHGVVYDGGRLLGEALGDDGVAQDGVDGSEVLLGLVGAGILVSLDGDLEVGLVLLNLVQHVVEGLLRRDGVGHVGLFVRVNLLHGEAAAERTSQGVVAASDGADIAGGSWCSGQSFVCLDQRPYYSPPVQVNLSGIWTVMLNA